MFCLSLGTEIDRQRISQKIQSIRTKKVLGIGVGQTLQEFPTLSPLLPFFVYSL